MVLCNITDLISLFYFSDGYISKLILFLLIYVYPQFTSLFYPSYFRNIFFWVSALFMKIYLQKLNKNRLSFYWGLIGDINGESKVIPRVSYWECCSFNQNMSSSRLRKKLPRAVNAHRGLSGKLARLPLTHF